MPLRLISPGKLVYEWQRAQYVWLLLRTLPAQVLLIYLEWDRYQDRIWPPRYSPKNPNSFFDGHKITTTLAACLLLRCIFWTHHSSLLILPVKTNMRKENVAPNQHQESSHVLAMLLTGDTFSNTLIKSYHILKINISIIIPHSFCFCFLSCP